MSCSFEVFSTLLMFLYYFEHVSVELFEHAPVKTKCIFM